MFEVEATAVQAAGDPLVDFLAQRGELHAGQDTDVEVQFAFCADPIRVVTAVDVSQVQGGDFDRKRRIAVLPLQFPTPPDQVSDHPVHALERADPQRRIAGMSRAAD